MSFDVRYKTLLKKHIISLNS